MEKIKKLKFKIFEILTLGEKIQTKYIYDKISYNNEDVFFGYYDVLQQYKNKLIYLRKHMKDSVDIYVRDMKTNRDTFISTSYAWNWQQGCRLRWINEYIGFNNFCNREYVFQTYNIKNKSIKTVCQALYDISFDGNIGLSLDFARLGILRPGYGYSAKNYVEPEDLNNEGIDLIDLKSGIIKRILTYNKIAQVTQTDRKVFHNCYINHLSFSPDSNKFMFFWIEVNNGFHQADLLVYDIKDKRLILLEKKMKVSHYVWMNNNDLLITAYDKDYKCGYYIYNICLKKNRICKDILQEDGHPSLIDKKRIITDTYPDKYGYQKLLFVDLYRHKIRILSRIYHNYKYQADSRCDLHPRILEKYDGQINVSIDIHPKKNREIIIIKGIKI